MRIRIALRSPGSAGHDSRWVRVEVWSKRLPETTSVVISSRQTAALTAKAWSGRGGTAETGASGVVAVDIGVGDVLVGPGSARGRVADARTERNGGRRS